MVGNELKQQGGLRSEKVGGKVAKGQYLIVAR
jgi:hypothetical protein